jgi:hypothetical protein
MPSCTGGRTGVIIDERNIPDVDGPRMMMMVMMMFTTYIDML